MKNQKRLFIKNALKVFLGIGAWAAFRFELLRPAHFLASGLLDPKSFLAKQMGFKENSRQLGSKNRACISCYFWEKSPSPRENQGRCGVILGSFVSSDSVCNAWTLK